MSSVTEVPRLRGVDRTEFLARFERPGTPVVLEGAVRESVAARTWSPATLRERLGDAPAEFKVSGSNAHPDFRQPNLRASFAREGASFAEFLDRIGSNAADARARYLFTGDEQFLWRRREKRTFVNEHYGVLLDDLPPPDLLPEERLYTIWVWFSGPGVRTWLHYDNNRCHNLNAQITGEKECWLFAPETLAALAPFPLGGQNPAYNCSQIDVDRPDPNRFPAFDEVPRLHARLQAGDALFIPAYWLHTFLHHGEFNANMNFWWLPESPIDNVVARRQVLLDLVASARLDARQEPAASVLGALDMAVLAGS